MNKRNETQQRILDAAIRVFAVKGYHGAKTAEIAKEAQVAEGSIFKYYKTKQHLLQGVLEFIIHEVVPEVIQQPFEEIIQKCMLGDPKAVIKQQLLKKAEMVSKNMDCIRIMLSEVQYHEDINKEYFGRILPGFLKHLEGVYSLGVHKGVFRSISPHTAARSFMGMFALMVLEKNVLDQRLDLEKELDTILDIFLNGASEKRE